MAITKHLLKNINLSEINFASTGTQITMNFIDMFKGNFYGRLAIDSVLFFNYQNAFDDYKHAFPTYIGEVICKEFSYEEYTPWLTKVGYGFTNADGNISIPHMEKLFFIQLESGEVSIDIICGDYKLNFVD